MEGRCGDCLFAKETEKVEEVECHGDLPKVVVLNTPSGPAFMTMFPRMPAIDGFCRFHEPGEPVPYSRILKVGAGAMPVRSPTDATK